MLAFMAAYIPFLWKLPFAVKKLMILSGIVFVGGALGMEALESYYHTETGQKGFYFAIMTSIEEAMEMLGILLFLYTLLHYIELAFGGISINLVARHNSREAIQTGTPLPLKDRPAVQGKDTLSPTTKPKLTS